MKLKKLFAENQHLTSIIALIAALLVGFYLSSGIVVFRNPVNSDIPFNIFIFAFVIYILLLGLSFFLNSFVKNKFKFALPLAASLTVIFIINIITTAVFKNQQEFTLISIDSNEYHGTYFVSNIEKIVFILQFFVMCMNVYLGLVIIPQMVKKQSTFKMFLYVYIVLIILLTIISYITEYQKYYNFFFNFTPQSVDGSTISPLGLYKNTFGYLLTLQIFAFIYLHNDNRKWYFILMMFVALFNILMILCKLGLIISSLAIIVYLIYLLIDTWKNNPKRNMIIAIVVGSIVVVGGLLVLVLTLAKAPFIMSLFDKLSKMFETKENTFFARTLIWKNCFTIVSTHNAYIFGCGYGVTGGLLYEYNTIDLSVYYNHTTHAHNIWIEYYAYGGISLALFAALLTVYLIYIIVKVWKKNQKIAFFSSLLMLCALIYGAFENYPIFFARSFESTMLGYMIVVPLMIEYYSLNSNEEEVVERQHFDLFNFIMMTASAVLGAIATISLAHIIVYKTNFWLIAIAAVSLAIFTLLPIVYSKVKNISLGNFLQKRGIIYASLFVGGILVSIIATLIFIECDFVTLLAAILVIAVCYIVCLSLDKTKSLIFVE